MPRTKPFALKLHEWLTADQDAWCAARAEGDVLDPGGPASRWSPATVVWMSNAYGHWLGWLKTADKFDSAAAPAQAVQPDDVVAYVAFLRSHTASSSVADRVQKLMHVARILDPARDWTWLRAVWRRLNSLSRPARNKQASLVEADRLSALGLELMGEAERQAGNSVMDAALLHRDGLIIALLAGRPIRLKNLSAIVIGQHLVRRDERYALPFAGSETKQRTPLDELVPSELTPYIDRYLSHHRPLLFPRNRDSKQPTTCDPSACSHLWVSNRGTAMDRRTIYRRVVARTKAKFGRSVSPHIFRDAVATTIAIHDPKHVGIATPILGHSKAATTEQYYNQARSLEAARRHQNTVLALRRMSRNTTAADPGVPE